MVKNYWYSKQRRQRVGLDLHSSKDVPESVDKEVTSEEEPNHNNTINFMQPDFKPAEIQLPINLFFLASLFINTFFLNTNSNCEMYINNSSIFVWNPVFTLFTSLNI